jgi:hypothetical protein
MSDFLTINSKTGAHVMGRDGILLPLVLDARKIVDFMRVQCGALTFKCVEMTHGENVRIVCTMGYASGSDAGAGARKRPVVTIYHSRTKTLSHGEHWINTAVELDELMSVVLNKTHHQCGWPKTLSETLARSTTTIEQCAGLLIRLAPQHVLEALWSDIDAKSIGNLICCCCCCFVHCSLSLSLSLSLRLSLPDYSQWQVARHHQHAR